ncbi:MAG: cytochrome c oxidase subunit 3 [Acidobacteria bacterium]|nr:cytochrome c oxidase subunit 3 [Acidobacteriota bacterium]
MSAHSLPAAPPARPRTLLIATALGGVAVTMLFAGLFGVYLTERSQTLAGGGEWFPSGSISLAPGGMMMVTMLLSVISLQWAHYATERDDRTHSLLALGLTILLGAAVVNQMVFVWISFAEPVDASAAALLFYVITGAFVALLVVAIAFLLLVTVRDLAGSYGHGRADGVAAAALFWYVTVAVYAAVWFAIFVTK